MSHLDCLMHLEFRKSRLTTRPLAWEILFWAALCFPIKSQAAALSDQAVFSYLFGEETLHQNAAAVCQKTRGSLLEKRFAELHRCFGSVEL